MNKRLILIILFVLVSSLKCLKQNDFCYFDQSNNAKKSKCHSEYSIKWIKCGDILCAKNVHSCKMLRIFSSVKRREGKKDTKTFVAFMHKIKDCPEPSKYKWNSKYPSIF